MCCSCASIVSYFSSKARVFLKFMMILMFHRSLESSNVRKILERSKLKVDSLN